MFCQKTESAVGAYLSTSIGRQDRPCYGASMRKSSVLLITIAVCLTSASPSYAKKITYSNGIQTQSALPTKADKVKCGKYHSPLVKVPKFKLVKQTCQDLDIGSSSMEFKAQKIYVSSDKVLFINEAPYDQIQALLKSLKKSVAKGWSLSSIDEYGASSGWTARLVYINDKTKVAVFANLEVRPEIKVTGCMDPPFCTNPKGKSWVVISVSNLHQEAWD